MDWWLASFFLGSILSLFLPIVPDLFVLFLLILFSIILFSYKPLRLTSSLFFGASWMLCNAFMYQDLWSTNNLNPLELAEAPQWIVGEVNDLQSIVDAKQTHGSKTKLRFNINVTHLNSNKLNTIIKMRLSWRNSQFPVQQGHVIKLKVKFKPAHGLANIGTFSYKTWLRSSNILATGYVINDKNNIVLLDRTSSRQQLFNHYNNLLPEHYLSPILLALGFGDRGELTPQLWNVLQATGTGHLIAISGLHIGLVVTGSYFVLMQVIRLFPLSTFNQFSFVQTLNIRYLVIALSLLIGLIYGYLAGFSLSTIRALVMLSLYWLSRSLNINISIKRWILLTLCLLVLITPFSLFTASFWLSVYAVTVIFVTLWRFKGALNNGFLMWRFIKGILVIQLSLTLMLLPISAIFFQQISLVALFANLVAVPWMSFFSIPLCLTSVLVMPFSESVSQLLINWCVESLHIIWLYLSYLAQQESVVIKLSNGHVQLFVLFGLISFFIIFCLSFVSFNNGTNDHRSYLKKFMLVIFFGVCLSFLFNDDYRFFDKQENNNQAKWQLIIFDVGQGLSVLITRDKQAILYDTGATYPSGFSMVKTVILPYLQHVGIEQLDKVIISHSDNDHAGGLTDLKEAIAIDELIYNEEGIEQNSLCLQGKSFVWQNLHFKMLWPDNLASEENDESCVILISDGKNKVLLSGDVTKKVEAKLLQKYPKLSADVLVVPHHGSKTSSSEAFISQLKPSTAIVSAGYLNRWHMPVSEVVERYHHNNVELLTTASSGQIIFNMTNDGITKQTYHRDLWPFWFAL